MIPTVLIIGGYGVFGGRLANQLLTQTDHNVIIAGRDVDKARLFCAHHGGRPCMLDRNDAESLGTVFAEIRPAIVVDAAGPFDFDGSTGSYGVALAALQAGAHYIDLADNADFVTNIALVDDAAQRARRVALSGVSSVPCLSSAAVAALTRDMVSVDTIDMAIVPGNRAPRGKAVVESILSQAGQTFRQMKKGAWHPIRCWGSLQRRNLVVEGTEPIMRRFVSPIEVPDQRLFPPVFGASTVRFSAGLEMRSLHLGLWAMTALVRFGVVQNLRTLAPIMHRIATWFEPLGSDRGGMLVDVKGTDGNGACCARRWTLIAEAGDGPNIPAIPARALIDSILSGHQTDGARPAVNVISLDEVERHFAPFAITSAIRDQALRTMTEPAE